jgi:hypothetical protein
MLKPSGIYTGVLFFFFSPLAVLSWVLDSNGNTTSDKKLLLGTMTWSVKVFSEDNFTFIFGFFNGPLDGIFLLCGLSFGTDDSMAT